MAVITPKDLRNAAGVALWFMFLTFPLLVVKINTVARTVEWRWQNLLWVGVAGFVASLVSRLFAARKLARQERIRQGLERQLPAAGRRLMGHPRLRLAAGVVLALFLLAFPTLFSTYQVNILTTALMYVVLGLGLNIVVGLAGLLDLGYVAFYAVGAYTYALLNLHFGLGFWTVLP
ncbi:MAG: branched-chain amino acid ABC transporter permease, partial [Desulfobulbus sp.]|nr:branched-chain amino acid ABC transporter permease [Desulfobulbus sp.]